MRFIGKLSRDKRGIGSLVGATFLILILVTSFAFYLLNLRTAERYDQTLQEMNDLDYDRSLEKIVIKRITVTDAKKLNVTVKNEGPIPSHLIWLGIFDVTSPPPTQKYYQLNRQVNPAETETGIGSTEMDDVIVDGRQYTIQVVTELGNIVVFYSYSPEEEERKGKEVGKITITGPDMIPWSSYTEYTIGLTYANGDPVADPLLLMIYINGSNIGIRLGSIPSVWTIDAGSGGNPWLGVVELDANGEFTFEFRSRVGAGEVFTLFIQVGDLVGKKEIVQLPRP